MFWQARSFRRMEAVGRNKGKVAERAGFEPAVPFDGYDGLANQRMGVVNTTGL